MASRPLIITCALIGALMTGGLAGRMTYAAARAATELRPGETRLEVGFSPDGNAEQIVLAVIGSARHTLRVSAYSFTSMTITKALIEAHKNRVDVQVVADENNNANSRYAAAAFGALTAAGIPVRLNGKYAIHHDKFIVADGVNVETGSFNYSASAAKRNSENALALWNTPALASQYETHWKSRFDEARPFTPGY